MKEKKKYLLSDFYVNNLKLEGNAKKLKVSDGGGLYVVVARGDQKSFVSRYNYGKKSYEIHLGMYPSMSLKKARDENDLIREWLKQGLEPKAERKKIKEKEIELKEYTVKKLSLEFLDHAKKRQVQPRFGRRSTYQRDLNSLDRYIFPKVGDRLLGDVKTPEWYEILLAVDTPKGEIRGKVKGVLSRVYTYAIRQGILENNPILALNGAFPRKPVEHMSALIDRRDVEKFIAELEKNRYRAEQSYYVIWMSYYTWLRPLELLSARWEYWDREKHMLLIPPENMKKGKNEQVNHYVPLSHQAEDMLLEIAEYNQKVEKIDNGYIFPSNNSKYGIMSDNTINKMIEFCGFKGKQTRHGFRSTARTIMGERMSQEYYEPMKRQLDHAPRDTVEASYYRTEYLEKRVEVMQKWADLLDEMKPKTAES